MRAWVFLFLIFVTISAGPALAATGDHWNTFQFGASVPAGEFGEEVRTGFHGSVSWTLMGDHASGIGLDAAYHTWGASEEAKL
jgi:hypothetical protein